MVAAFNLLFIVICLHFNRHTVLVPVLLVIHLKRIQASPHSMFALILYCVYVCNELLVNHSYTYTACVQFVDVIQGKRVSKRLL